jgi:hypothetical protein
VEQHRPRVQVQVIDVEADCLADPGAGAVEQLEERPVTGGDRRPVEAGRLDDRDDVVDRQGPWQPPRRSRRPDRGRRVGNSQPFAAGEPVQATDRDDGTGGRRRSQRRVLGTSGAQGSEEAADVRLGQVIDRPTRVARPDIINVTLKVTSIR